MQLLPNSYNTLLSFKRQTFVMQVYLWGWSLTSFSMACWHPWASSAELSVSSCQSGSRSWPVWQSERWRGCRNSQILRHKTRQNEKKTALAGRFTRKVSNWAVNLLTEAFTLVGGTVDKDLRWDDVSEWQEHLQDLGVSELLWQVIDEDVTAFRTWAEGRHGRAGMRRNNTC